MPFLGSLKKCISISHEHIICSDGSQSIHFLLPSKYFFLGKAVKFYQEKKSLPGAELLGFIFDFRNQELTIKPRVNFGVKKYFRKTLNIEMMFVSTKFR